METIYVGYVWNQYQGNRSMSLSHLLSILCIIDLIALLFYILFQIWFPLSKIILFVLFGILLLSQWFFLL